MLKKIVGLTVALVLCAGVCFAALEDAVKAFLAADYTVSIQQAKNLIARGSSRDERAQGYLLVALSYLRLNQFEDSRRACAILVQDFPQSYWAQRGRLLYADTFFLQGDFTSALKGYSELIRYTPASDITSLVYFRLGQTNLKLGNWQDARNYLSKAKNEYPDGMPAELAERLLQYEFLFTVQVGSYQDYDKAKALVNELVIQGHDAYIVQINLESGTFYRVRVGRLSKRDEVIALKEKLAGQGYSTLIYP